MAIDNEPPKIKLYTNHRCPWAHRVHIALSELNVPFEEEIIDLDTPRTAAYLKVNPRGLVPAISYNGEIMVESGIISLFLADAHPSHLLPPPSSVDGALFRAHVNFFVDTFFSKVQPLVFKMYRATSDADKESTANDYVDAIAKELDPLLVDAAPFFGGHDQLTLAEVLTGSFDIRLVTQVKHGFLPSVIAEKLPKKAPHFWKWVNAVAEHPSVTNIYDEQKQVEQMRKRFEKMKAAQAQNGN